MDRPTLKEPRMTRQHRKAHSAVRAEQTLRKALQKAQQPPMPRKITPANPQAVPRVRSRKRR